ncbi:MAG: hypothetical protein QNL31_03100 [Flavobacteriaceae bacterium]
MIEIEEKLEDFKIKISNLDKKVSELIEFSKNLSNIWVSGKYETKLSVQKLLFPEGIVIDPEDRTYRTSNLNPIFGLIHSFTGGNDDANKKRTSSNTDPSCVVDNSFEISNISFTPKEFELTIKMIKNNLNYSLLGFEKITPAIEPKSNK